MSLRSVTDPRQGYATCASGAAAASKAIALLSRGQIELDPFRAKVDVSRCRGEGTCRDVCEHQQAITLVETRQQDQTLRHAQVNAALCNGCGMCVAVCPNRAIEVEGWELRQFEAMVDALVADD